MPAASVRAAAAAVTFLTRVPVGRAVALDGGDVARGALLFPLVGAGVGAVAGGVALLAQLGLSALLSAALAVAVATTLTGAMHVDALADTADALGAFTRERALEIMRDSRIGSFGAAAVVLDLLVKTAAIAELLRQHAVLASLLAAGALSRGSSVALASTLGYPRAGGGTGSVLTGRVSRIVAALAALTAVAVAVVALRLDGAIVAAAAVGATVTLGFAYRRWLGGATGDALGAATELGETLALVIAAAVT
jgi:adenosylcobinamide-GDP ribazoletransferase